MKLFHDDVVLEVRVAPEVETNPVAQFRILDRLNLRNAERIHFRRRHDKCVSDQLSLCTLNSPYLKVSHVTEGIFVRLVYVS